MGGLVDGSSGGREPRAAERGLQTGSAGLARGSLLETVVPGLPGLAGLEPAS